MDGAIKGLQGWIACFEKATLKGVIRGVGAEGVGAVRNIPGVLENARDMGANV